MHCSRITRPALTLAAALASTLASTLISPLAFADPNLINERQRPVSAAGQQVEPQLLVDNLDHPWAIAFTSDGKALITERSGSLRVLEYVSPAGASLTPVRISAPVQGLPEIWSSGQGGLLDVAEHQGWVYFSYSEPSPRGSNSTAVMRARLVKQGAEYQLQDQQRIFSQQPKYPSRSHFGSRLVFDQQGHLFITLGERYSQRDDAQTLDNHHGKVVRINLDGSIPADNPYVNTDGALPEIWSLGHRNPQGAVLDPETGDLLVHEHGPRGGDELNRIEPGHNYGWPVITYGKEYIGGSIGEGTEKAGMEQPLHYWVPSIAPSGMAWVDSQQYPQWTDTLAIGSLKFQQLALLKGVSAGIATRKADIHEERLDLPQLQERIRDVTTGPDGLLYLVTDEDEGKLVRLNPVAAD